MSRSLPAPVRSRLRCLAPEEIERLNEGRPAPLRFLSAEEEVMRLALRSPERLKEAEARRLVEHPDERVACLVVRLMGQGGPSSSSRRRPGMVGDYDVLGEMGGRAAAEADREGVLWTPLLDVLLDVGADDYALRQTTGWEARVTHLQLWAAQVTEPGDLEALGAFESGPLRYVQLAHAQTIPEPLLPHWVRNSSDAIRIFQNRPLLERHLPAFLLHILTLDARTVYEMEHEIGRLDPDLLMRTPPKFQEEVVKRCLEGEHMGALALLLPHLTSVRERTVARVLRRRRSRPSTRASALFHPNTPLEAREQLLQGRYGFDEEIVSHPAADTETLEAAYRKEGAAVVRAVLYHPNVSDSLALEIVRSWDWRESNQPAGLPPAFRRGVVALEVMSQLSPRQACQIVGEMDLPGETGRDLLLPWAFQELVRAAWTAPLMRAEVVEVLARQAERAPLVLPRDFVLEMLSSEEVPIREGAIRLSGRLRSLLEEEREAMEHWAVARAVRTPAIRRFGEAAEKARKPLPPPRSRF